ncbi:FMN-binding protein [Lacisediminihabitans profunda]|uniref:FMN-binding protein n=1 Tax=Lacisediminihabitans profunda TaxID=2594790 RepID=A0A5C8UMC3_9MICO|nr:FMN-binding protein [Lacisediminihabitans profunda]
MTGIFASVSVLVIGWQFGAAAISTATSASQGTSTTGASSGAAPAATPTAGASAGATTATTAAAGPKDGSYTGTSENTPFGNVQVKVVVAGGKITSVVALQLTDNGGRSVQISNYAAPILRSEVIKAQSAKVSNVSGATYTTDGYLSSAQSALDQAGF